MRTLASIQRIRDIQAIPNAEAIEVATVLGWHVVVKKGEFQVGDLVVYCEVDSILPEKPEFAFLAKSKYRIKTVRLRGQISQGICFATSILPAETEIVEGKDVTDIIGVKKYEIPVPAQLAGQVRGSFPGFLPKTDETRIQAVPHILEKYQDRKFFVTEKIDGSSCTFVIKNDEFHVCSRNLDLREDDKNTLWKMARHLKVEEKMRAAGLVERIALQGEIAGDNIQGNPLQLHGHHIFFFNAYDFQTGEYLHYADYASLFEALDLPTAPVIHEGLQLPLTVDEFVTYATRKSSLNPEVWSEGIVIRPFIEAQDEDLGRLSFKVINPEYLLKHE